MPPPAQDASFPVLLRSRIITLAPWSKRRSAVASPMIPAPMIMTSCFMMRRLLVVTLKEVLVRRILFHMNWVITLCTELINCEKHRIVLEKLKFV